MSSREGRKKGDISWTLILYAKIHRVSERKPQLANRSYARICQGFAKIRSFVVTFPCKISPYMELFKTKK
jgi:hypothetical protein